MYIRFTTFNFVTMVVMGLTIWLAWARFSMRSESNWPLFYYLAVVGYFKTFDGALNPYWVYVGVVNALFLRFEFLGGLAEKIPRFVEMVFLGYVLWRGIALILLL